MMIVLCKIIFKLKSRRKRMPENESLAVVVVLCELKFPSLKIIIRYHSASLVKPNSAE